VKTTSTSTIVVKPQIPDTTRQLIVRNFGMALAAAWRQQHEASNEKAQKPRVTASGRGDVRGDGGRERHDSESSTIAT
jgi:hypothetical protein